MIHPLRKPTSSNHNHHVPKRNSGDVVLAGWLVDAASWRWIFLINVPLGLLAAALCARLLPFQPANPAAARRPDWTGLAQLSTGAVLVVLGGTLIARPGTPAWQPAACLAVGLLLGALFAIRSRPHALGGSRSRSRVSAPDVTAPISPAGASAQVSAAGVTAQISPAGVTAQVSAAGVTAQISPPDELAKMSEGGGSVRDSSGERETPGASPAAGREPLIDLGLLRHRAFRVAVLVLAAFGAGYFGAMSILPIFVQGVRGDPAALAGALAIPAAVAVGATVQVATRLVDRVAAWRIVLTGVLLGSSGVAVLLAATTTDSGYPAIVAGSVLLGIGSGATLLPGMTVALRDLDGAEIPRGTPLLALVQQLGSAVGVAIVATGLSVLLSGPTDGGGVAAMLGLDPASRAARQPDLARAAGSSYLFVLLLLALSVVAALSLRRGETADTRPPSRTE